MTSWLFRLITLCALWGRLSCLRCMESRHSDFVARSTFDCSSRNITQLPINISSRATELNLARNNITVLPKYAFRQLPNLVRLDLSHCGILLLEKNCFVGLLHLRQLIIANNKFDPARLPRETFAGLSSLRLLAISRRGIAGEYPVSILEDLKELRTLSVTSQGIPLPNAYGRLANLTTLVLDGYAPWTKSTKIIRLMKNTFAAIRDSNINNLMIRRSNIHYIEAGTFSNFKNLHALNLACSDRLNVSQMILALDQIENTTINTVVLDGTYHFDPAYGFQVYDINDFCNSPIWKNVKRLSLRNIRLPTFVPRDVNCLSGLQELSVGYNPLTFTISNNSADLRHFASLQSIDISYSNVPGPGYRYKYCRTCSALFHMEDFFPRVPRLHFVVNSSVPDEFVKDSAYSPNFFIPPFIRYIDASSSNFKRLSTLVKVFSFSRPNNVLFLNVSGTRTLNRVNGLLVGLSQLQILDASYGVVESIHPEFLKHLPLLRVLNQSHNHLGRGNNNFSAIFGLARRLKDVDLSNNGLTYIDPSTFVDCTALKQIKLRDNMFRSFDIALGKLTSLNVLDISENRLPYLNESFMKELDKLRKVKPFSIDMRRNNFVCNCESLSFVRWVQTTLVDVVGRTDMMCLMQSSRKRFTEISVKDLRNECSGAHRYVVLYSFIGVVVVILVIAVIAAMCKCVPRRRRENPLVYIPLNMNGG